MQQMPPIVALILAAGTARRFGSDKRLVRLPDNRGMLAASVDAALDAFNDVRVVLRPEDDAVLLGLSQACHVVRSPCSGEGMAHSLSAGVSAALASGATAIAVLLGDMPAINSSTLRELALHSNESTIVVPIYSGKRGHPVLFGRDFWPELLHLQGDKGGREVLHRHPAQVREVVVNDAGIHFDVDDPKGLDSLGDLLRQ